MNENIYTAVLWALVLISCTLTVWALTEMDKAQHLCRAFVG